MRHLRAILATLTLFIGIFLVPTTAAAAPAARYAATFTLDAAGFADPQAVADEWSTRTHVQVVLGSCDAGSDCIKAELGVIATPCDQYINAGGCTWWDGTVYRVVVYPNLDERVTLALDHELCHVVIGSFFGTGWHSDDPRSLCTYPLDPDRRLGLTSSDRRLVQSLYPL